MPKPIYTFPLMPEGRPTGHQGPPSACIPQVGRLLQALAAGKPGGRIAEQGDQRRPGLRAGVVLSRLDEALVRVYYLQG